MKRTLTCGVPVLAILLAPAPAPAQPPGAGAQAAYAPYVAPASGEAAEALRAFRLAPGLRGGVFAAEPLLANPVAFTFDERGRAYVVETFRLHHGVTDTRQHMNWLDEDLASRSVADRVAKYRKFLGPAAEDYGKEHDRVRLVEDRDGDGRADTATVFADGFRNIPDGLAAGVLARGGDVYLACIPDLWLLRDRDGDGRADEKTSLHHGYGVHTGFLGHDLHGLILGPDGRLYFSIGDRGLNVKTLDGRTLFLPDAGAVLRCEPDGARLELFATGLRNPQELAFDDLGNLFTVDNNSDSGDRARITYLMEGGDSGWSMGWQYIEWPNSRGPWNAEKLWHPPHDGQPAHVVPPLANFSDGPSGLAYHPGVARLPDRLRGHFFLCDFRGAPAQSGVHAFTLKPEGAGFALGTSERVAWGLEATDVEFGPDGALCVSDWVEGWGISGKGRIYTFHDPDADPAPAREVASLLAEGFSGRPLADLKRLLGHADRRVRQGAQFALAARGADAAAPLGDLARDGDSPRLARVHAAWGLGQLARAGVEARPILRPLLSDADPEVRAQSARVLGDVGDAEAAPGLVALLDDESPRVRSLAAIALGRLGRREAVGPLLTLLRRNADADPFLRHAAVMGLAGAASAEDLATAATDPAPAVRLGVLLAMRRRRAPDIARFLDDAEPRLVAEAARAIYDAGIDEALPRLAAIVDSPRSDLDASTLRRALSAAARLGGTAQARSLAAYAARGDRPDLTREEAVRLLAEWPAPSGRDPVTGLWRPRTPRPAAEAGGALAAVAGTILASRNSTLRAAVLRAVGPLPMASLAPTLRASVADADRFSTERAEALRALERLDDPGLADAAATAAADASATLRVEGRRLLARLRPAEAVPLFAKVLEEGTVVDRQGALETLGTMAGDEADALLAEWLDRLAAGAVAPEVELDLLDAAGRRKAPEVVAKLRAIEAGRPEGDPIAEYLPTLAGGNARRGQQIIRNKSEIQCIRCHKINGNGGEVGPELAGVATRGDRRYLLESLVIPDKQIAQGFESVVVATDDGQVRTGVLREETEDSLRLVTAEGEFLTIPKASIEERKRGPSAMPADLVKFLTKSELRDVLAYLATLRTPWNGRPAGD